MYGNNSMRPMIVVALSRWPQAPTSNTEKVGRTEELLGTLSSSLTFPYVSHSPEI